MQGLLRWLKSLRSPDGNPFIFFAAAFLLGVCINLTSNRIEGYLKEKHYSQLGITFILGFVGFILLAMILEQRLSRSKEVSSHLLPARPARWLVVLVSAPPGDATARAAIRYHLTHLYKIWLICSTGEGVSSVAAAESIARELAEKQHVQAKEVEIVRLNERRFKDPEAVRNEIEKIYQLLPYPFSERDVIIDITGGLKTTTAGAFLAGLPVGRRLEIINPLKTDESGHGTEAGDPVEIVVDYSLKRVRSR